MSKKIICSMVAVALTFWGANAFAATMTQANAGDSVVITTTTITTDPGDFTFTPSANVYMSGNTAANAFAVNAAHESALGKANGRIYGMASDSSVVYWDDAPTTWADLSGTTNSSAFSAYNKE